MNHGAMETNLNKKKKAAEMKERIQTKALLKEAQKLQQTCSLQQTSTDEASAAAIRAKIVEDELIALFDSAEKPEKSLKSQKKNNKKKT